MSESVQSNSAVLVHFTLKLDDGTTAESTRNNGKPALFRLGDASPAVSLWMQASQKLAQSCFLPQWMAVRCLA